jgi:hypothetical protein
MGKKWVAIQQKTNRSADWCRAKYHERAKATARTRTRARTSAAEVMAEMAEC